jgi:hypothetical protein
MCPGNVLTALKRQAPLRLRIPLKQTKSDSKTKIEDPMHPTEKKDKFSARQVLFFYDSPCLLVWTQQSHWGSGIWDKQNTSYM